MLKQSLYLLIAIGGFILAQTSPYSGQLDSPVRGLSPQEVSDLLNGRGAGYARSAELNGHPGPAHLLELKTELKLSPQQIAAIEVTQSRMRQAAKTLGAEIVAKEKTMSMAFAAGKLSEQTLQTQTEALGLLYGRYRAVHLKAHLDVTPLLTSAQIAAYNILRGYNNPSQQHNHQR